MTDSRDDPLLLLTPGPTILPDAVRRALTVPMPHHREPRFREALRECLRGLREMLSCRHVVLLASSGRGGLEASLVNACSPGDTVLACTNGHFGQAGAKMAADLGLRVHEIATDWSRPVDPDEVRAAVRAHPGARAVMVVQSETSTGILNDVEALGRALALPSPAGEGPLLLVDVMSSMGSAALDLGWGLDAIAGCSQKGLMAPPGAAVVAVSDRYRARMADARFPRSYWDFERALKSLALDPPETVNTSPVPVILAMAAALRVLRAEGYTTAYARNASVAARAREAIRAMGLSYVTEGIDPRRCSPTVTTVRRPDGIAPQEILRTARERYGVMFQRGLGRLADTTFRIGHLGVVGETELARGFEALEGTLRALGATVVSGAWQAAIESSPAGGTGRRDAPAGAPAD